MKHPAAIIAVVLSTGLLSAQEEKKVPKDSVRVSIPGCTTGYVFTVGERTADQPGTVDIPEGMHLRMTGPKKMMAEIKAHEGAMLEITGIMKKGQDAQLGVPVGGGVRVAPVGPGGGISVGRTATQNIIDVEGWRPVAGNCRTR